jgi:hypothetical protein
MALDMLPLAVQTTYAELVDQARVALVSGFEPGSTFRQRILSGRAYWYAQPAAPPATAGGSAARPKERYLGPASPDLDKAIAEARTIRQQEADRRTLVKSLAGAGLPVPDRLTGDLLAALAGAGVFRLRGVLIGTTAFQAYAALLGVRLPLTALRTADIDVAQDFGVSVALDDASEPSVLAALQGVDPSFRAVPDAFEKELSAVYVNARQMRVDMLTTSRGAPARGPSRLPALQAAATPMRFMDFLLRDAVDGVMLHRAGVLVRVPDPARFAVHKLIVAADRSGPGLAKATKDIAQAALLIEAHALQRREDVIVEAWAEALARGEGWRERLMRGRARLPEDIAALLPVPD